MCAVICGVVMLRLLVLPRLTRLFYMLMLMPESAGSLRTVLCGLGSGLVVNLAIAQLAHRTLNGHESPGDDHDGGGEAS